MTRSSGHGTASSRCVVLIRRPRRTPSRPNKLRGMRRASTVDLNEPRERISGELTGKRPARIELADLQKVEDCSGAGRTGLGGQPEVLAQRIGAHVGLLGFFEEEVDAPDRVGYAAGPGACQAAHQWRWPLAAQGGNETPAKVAVFIGQMLGVVADFKLSQLPTHRCSSLLARKTSNSKLRSVWDMVQPHLGIRIKTGSAIIATDYVMFNT